MIKKSEISKKKRLVCITAFLLCLILVVSIVIIKYVRNLPVDWDAGACGGGYATFIFDKYSDELTQKFVDGSKNGSDILSAEAIRGTQIAEWEDKTLFLQFDIKFEHSKQGTLTETVRFVGQRTWFDTFDWGGAVVVGD